MMAKPSWPDPANPADSAEPSWPDPANPADSADSAEPPWVEPSWVDLANSGDPADPSEPEEPTEPVGPSTSAGWVKSPGSGRAASPRRPALTMATGVACTTRSIPRRSCGRPTSTTFGANAAPRHAGATLLFTTTIFLAPASARASTAARPAPPAPITPQRRPAGSKPAPSRRSSNKPAPSQLSARMAPASKLSVFAAPSRRTCRDRRVASRAAASLCGIVTDRPRRPSAAAPTTALSTDPGGTSNAR